MTSDCSNGAMSCPVQVVNTGASYKIVSDNFEYCPLCHTIELAYRKTALAEMLVNCGTLQLRDILPETEQRTVLSPATELCHAQINIICLQQAVEEKGPSEPSALTFGSVWIARDTPKQVQVRRARRNNFAPAIPEAAHSRPQLLVTGRL